MNKVYAIKFCWVVLMCLMYQINVQADIDASHAQAVSSDSSVENDQEQDDVAIKGSGCCASSGCSCSATIKKLPFQIKKPGVYCVCGDLNASACDVTITICSNDVVVDLKGFTIINGNRGIELASGLHNVIIKNGTISTMEQEGVLVGAGSSDIQLCNLSVINCNQSRCNGLAAVAVAGSDVTHCSGITIKDVVVSSCDGVGFSMNAVDNSCILESCALSIASNMPNVPTAGFLLNNCNFFVINKCKASQIVATHVGSRAAGFFISDSNGVRLLESEASNNVALSPANAAAGVLIQEGEFVMVRDCLSRNNSVALSGAVSSALPDAVGFQSDNSLATLFLDCKACGNTVPCPPGCTNNPPINGTGNGFVLSNDFNSMILESVSQDNTTDGFFVTTCIGCVIGKSKAAANSNIGFEVQPAPPFPDNIPGNRFFSNFSGGNCICDYLNLIPTQTLADQVFCPDIVAPICYKICAGANVYPVFGCASPIQCSLIP